MGVPKFFRFISERYPCLSEVVREYQIPEYDNLYLDMNGIIHTCSHPNDSDPLFRISEEQIYRDIFHYIEILFHMIKPQKMFFMAVDGVAPRAKMNQQRGRRFRSAKNATELERAARKKGQVIPEEARFDSNCITPGTVFMTRLNEQLKYFIASKITNDKLWQKCKVILSGHETPGEGEHKIMDYIRHIKSQPDYDSNTRHCLYGLDADLIMLGLCTHEPHFSLLREETQFGKKQKRVSTPEKMKFYLLHLSMMREYIEHEFSSLKNKLCFEYDMEKIIDDWVLMGFLIGNDFIPNLPHLEINDGAFPTLYSVYMEVLPTLDGYLNEGGSLMLNRFEKFMNHLSQVEINHFRNAHASSESVKIDVEFSQHKRDYYMNKLGYKNVDAYVLRCQAECYVRAIQWNLNYYYNGCCSWSWYYPHHYAPYISDIKGFKDMKLEFEMGQPFLPFQQLLAVLPAASGSLLPQPFESLMIDKLSPIKDYYPADFDTDQNGKRQEWEAVVLIPFIQEKNLLEAMEPCYAKLTLEENQRNSHGPMNVYSHTKDDLGSYEALEYFPNLPTNHAKSEPINPEDVIVPREKLVKGLCPGTSLDVYFPGFPTMKHIDHTSELQKAVQTKSSKHVSGSRNRIQINILPSETCPNLAELASQIIGKQILVSWPHLVEAHVVAVSSRETIFRFVDDRPNESIINKKMNEPLANQWDESNNTIAQDYIKKLGINVGKTEILVHAHLLTGRYHIFDAQGRVSLKKQWSNVASQFALQATVRDIAVHESSFVEYTRIGQIFTPKSICFMLEHPHYGAAAEVVKVHTHFKVCRVKLALWITQEPMLDSLKERAESKPELHYMYSSQATKKLPGMTNHLLGRITGSLFVVRGPKGQSVNGMKHNLGLDLKFNKKNEEVPDYTKKIEGQWVYGIKTVELLRAYMLKYPALFEHLAKNVKINTFHEDDLFPATGSTTLNDVLAWLKQQPFKNVQRRSCTAEALDQGEVQELEQVVDAFIEEQKNGDNVKTVMMQVKPHLLYKSSLQIGNFPPDVAARYKIYDRIVNVRESFTVPIAYKGTIVGIERSRNIADCMFEVVFDKTFAGGYSVNMCSANRGYRLGPADFINLSHGVRTGSLESVEPKADAEL